MNEEKRNRKKSYSVCVSKNYNVWKETDRKGRETLYSVCVNKIYNTYFKCASIKKRNERKKGRETSSHSVCVSKNYNNIK